MSGERRAAWAAGRCSQRRGLGPASQFVLRWARARLLSLSARAASAATHYSGFDMVVMVLDCAAGDAGWDGERAWRSPFGRAGSALRR